MILKSWIRLKDIEPVGQIEGYKRHWATGIPHDLRDQVFPPGQYKLVVYIEPGPKLSAEQKLALIVIVDIATAGLRLPGGAESTSKCQAVPVALEMKRGRSYVVNGSVEDDGCWVWIADVDSKEIVAGTRPPKS